MEQYRVNQYYTEYLGTIINDYMYINYTVYRVIFILVSPNKYFMIFKIIDALENILCI
jgi:hypothetical protein